MEPHYLRSHYTYEEAPYRHFNQRQSNTSINVTALQDAYLHTSLASSHRSQPQSTTIASETRQLDHSIRRLRPLSTGALRSPLCTATGQVKQRPASYQDQQSLGYALDTTTQSAGPPPFLYSRSTPHLLSSSRSAPDEMQHVSRSSPNRSVGTASHSPSSSLGRASPSGSNIRSPTYPSTTRPTRRRSTYLAGETFENDNEFHLFAQATFGLGPDTLTFSPTSPDAPPPQSTNPSRPAFHRNHTANLPLSQHPHHPSTSPIDQTGTLTAFHQLASLPSAPLTTHAFHRRTPTPLQTSALSGVELWLQPPSANESDSAAAYGEGGSRRPWMAPNVHENTFDTEDRDGGRRRLGELDEDDDAGRLFAGLSLTGGGRSGVGGDDDELPDYAQSQAQAQQRQRVEAARRAQELQRRWLMSR